MDKLNKTFGEEDTLYPSDMNAITSKIDEVIDYVGNGKLVINVNGAKYNDDFSANSAEDVEININTPSIFIPKGFNPDERADSEEEAEEYEIEHDEGVITLKWWQGDRKEYEYAVHNVAIRDVVDNFMDVATDAYIMTYCFVIDFDINMNNTVIGENLSLVTDDETGAYHVEQSSHKWYINGRNAKNNINGNDIAFWYSHFVMDFGNTNASRVGSITKYTGVVHCEAVLTINDEVYHEYIRRAFSEGVLQYLKGYLCLNQNRC